MIDGNYRGISKWIYKCGGGEGERGEGRRGVRKRGRGEGGRGSCKEEGKEVSEFFLYFLKLLSGILQHLNFPRDLSSS